MTKLCIVCKEQEVVSSARCQDCKNMISRGGSVMTGKWRVAIQTCKEGHRYVPINGECLVCNPAAGAPRKCEYCKKVTVSGKNRFCTRKCAHEHRINQLTDNYCLNCNKQLRVFQNKVCSLQCNGAYKKKKIDEVLASLKLDEPMKKKTCLVCGKILKNQGMGGGGCNPLHNKVIFNYGYYWKGEFYISESGKKFLEKNGGKMV